VKCPRTNTNLKSIKVGGVEIDISEACGGVFFDNFELKKFDEDHELRGSVLVEHLNQFTPPVIDHDQRLKCPKCIDTTMYRRFYSPQKKIEIDECRTCGGVWLDFGELDAIRKLFPTEEKREELSTEFYESIINGRKFQELQSEEQEDLEKMKRITRSIWRIIGL